MLTKIVAFLTAFIVSLFPVTPTPTPALPTPTVIPTPTSVIHTQLIKMDAPFTSQAPNYDWKDPRLQDACEETAVLMAYYWVKDKSLTPTSALKEILAMVDYQKLHFDDYRDTSLSDTASRLLSGYYTYDNYKIYTDITLPQIIDQLYQKHLVILPMNGKMLHNPNYTGAGPDRHMLLLIGYDPQTHEFITNDAGTWKGPNYRYSEDVIYSSIRDYVTGYHVPIPESPKNMLVVY